jgi:hypothetical protein
MAGKSISRREALRLLGMGTTAAGLTACGLNTTTPVAAPVQPTAAPPTAVPVAPTAVPTVAPVAVAPGSIELEIKTVQPEYHAQTQQIWDVYLQSHPELKFKYIDVNEDTQAAYDARVAAGNPADIDCQAACNQDTYKNYVNLLDVPSFNWGIFHKGAKTAFEEIYGIPNYIPLVNAFAGYFWTFIYYKDKMAEAGLDPKTSVKTMDDLKVFLANLKDFVDKSGGKYEYVLDQGWHPWVWGTVAPTLWSMSLGHGKQELRDLFLGKVRWDDKANNPLVPYFESIKEFYEKGYMPDRWWTRNWDEFENGFIAQKSILTTHGPWLWDKVNAANPNAQLEGFNWPPDKDNQLFVTPTAAYAYNTNAATIYTANKSKPNFAAAQDALLWWYSPESIKLQCEAIGWIPACDLSSVGGADLKHPQYIDVVQPVLEGKAGSLKYDDSLMGPDVAARYKNGGAENVMESDAMAGIYGDYFEGKTSLDDLLKTLQQRSDAAYTFPT